jgi:uncharacterized cupin superfamily protein
MPTIKDIVVRKPTKEEIAACSAWPIWTCEPSTFDYSYGDKETCLILEGKVKIESPDGKEAVSFAAGDLVIFPKGLSCVWKVEKAVRKHYNFG